MLSCTQIISSGESFDLHKSTDQRTTSANDFSFCVAAECNDENIASKEFLKIIFPNISNGTYWYLDYVLQS